MSETNQTIPPILPPRPEFHPTVVFNDGTTLAATGGMTLNREALWIWPQEPMEIADAVLMLTDEQKTSKITLNHSRTEAQDCIGFTKLTAVNLQGNGLLAIRLSKPSN